MLAVSHHDGSTFGLSPGSRGPALDQPLPSWRPRLLHPNARGAGASLATRRAEAGAPTRGGGGTARPEGGDRWLAAAGPPRGEAPSRACRPADAACASSPPALLRGQSRPRPAPTVSALRKDRGTPKSSTSTRGHVAQPCRRDGLGVRARTGFPTHRAFARCAPRDGADTRFTFGVERGAEEPSRRITVVLATTTVEITTRFATNLLDPGRR